MKEHGIIFNADMVRADLAGKKWQTRRPVKHQFCRSEYEPELISWWEQRKHETIECCGSFSELQKHGPYGGVGDVLWIRETWRIGAWKFQPHSFAIDYKADNYPRQEWLSCNDELMFLRLFAQTENDAYKREIYPNGNGIYDWKPGHSPAVWRPSIHMPKWACRTKRRITGVRLQRVQDISAEDQEAEGCGHEFAFVWDAIYKERGLGWDANPWVWVYEYDNTINRAKTS
ncbi:hypothetical protein [Sediminispirochaeta smaragdinae]|uniref:Morphogenetic protein n=1 Tax=Sediminispirochaeta smaragdinae (strain DSM 11293 / JCM 15392 / SEBR 4228) TaxID=573413 RepID=E1R1F5_SEDSS|nr:hypothetical protein [Sediminispirochaeta smaragdinae]ADK81096.1 conserved hypothetical protein [Sediminispirochaeta smaragdinae DSM 11293]